VLPTAQRHRIGVLAWSPLAGGWLTGKYRREVGKPATARYGSGGSFPRPAVEAADEARYDVVEKIEAIAVEAGLTMIELAYAFVAEHPAVTATLIGPRTREQLDAALGAADLRLDAATLDALDAVVPPGTDVPGVDHFTGDPSLLPAARRSSDRRADDVL
jgi:aryl-alcohol dehydrogenase-like predicted oxidoreductase